MKIEALFEELPQKTVKLNRPIGSVNADGQSGAFSSVKPVKNNPDVMRKTSHSTNKPGYDPEQTDGYWEYIKGINRLDEFKDNPFAPKVHGMKSIEGSNGKKIARADIERLIPWSKVNPKALEEYCASIVNNEHSSFKIKDYMTNVATILDQAASSGNMKNIKNADLANLLSYVHDLSDLYIVDINDDNIMFRQGPNGLQMVITDPVGQSYLK